MAGLTAALLLGGMFAHVGAQHPPTEKNALLSLGSTDALPDSEAVVPVLYFPEPGQAGLTALTLRLCVSDKHVVFAKARPGMGGEAGKAEVTSKQGAREGACEPIEVETTFKAAPKSGTLLELVFNVDKDATIDQTVKIDGKFTVRDGGAAAREPIAATGEVRVMKSMPVFSCFFYMH